MKQLLHLCVQGHYAGANWGSRSCPDFLHAVSTFWLKPRDSNHGIQYTMGIYIESTEFSAYNLSQFCLFSAVEKWQRLQKGTSQHFVSVSLHLSSTLPHHRVHISALGLNLGRQTPRRCGFPQGTHRRAGWSALLLSDMWEYLLWLFWYSLAHAV